MHIMCIDLEWNDVDYIGTNCMIIKCCGGFLEYKPAACY